MCQVTGSRRASLDLPQGGLEVQEPFGSLNRVPIVPAASGKHAYKWPLLEILIRMKD